MRLNQMQPYSHGVAAGSKHAKVEHAGLQGRTATVKRVYNL